MSYNGPDRRSYCTLNEMQAIELIENVKCQGKTLAEIDKQLTLHLERQERFFERLERLEEWRAKFEIEQEEKFIKRSEIKWIIVIIGTIAAIITWSVDLIREIIGITSDE